MNDLRNSFFNLNGNASVAVSATVFIYGLNDPTTGKCRYVGKAADPHKRFGKHLLIAGRRSTYKDCWIQELAAQGLKPVLEVLDEVPALEWEFWEREYIRVFRMVGFSLTNLTDGGDGISGVTERTRAKMSAARKGKHLSEDTCERMRVARTGKILSEETRAKIGASNFGKRRSSEARSKMREVHIGKPLSERHRLNICLARKENIARRTLAGLTPYRRKNGA